MAGHEALEQPEAPGDLGGEAGREAAEQPAPLWSCLQEKPRQPLADAQAGCRSILVERQLRSFPGLPSYYSCRRALFG